jgi:hypothetical protein
LRSTNENDVAIAELVFIIEVNLGDIVELNGHLGVTIRNRKDINGALNLRVRYKTIKSSLERLDS